MVGRPARRSGSGWETILEVQKLSGDPHGGTEVVRRPSRKSGSGRRPFLRFDPGRKTLPEFRKWSGDPPGGTELVGRPPGGPELAGRPSRWSGTVRETFLVVRKWLEALPEVRNW